MVVSILQPDGNPTLEELSVNGLGLIQGSADILKHLEEAADLDLVSAEDAGPLVGDILLRTIRVAHTLNLDLMGCLTLARIQ